MSYHHLTTDERETIRVTLSQGAGPSEIAKLIGRNKSTISREITRNGGPIKYRAHYAQQQYLERRVSCRPSLKVNDPMIRDAIWSGLNQYWSPEQIVGAMKLPISVPTIYRAVHAGLIPTPLQKKLRRQGKRHKPTGEDGRGTIPNCISIDDRPVEAAARNRLGDWEGDTLAGKRNTGHLVTLTDRKTRFLVASKVPNRKAEIVKDAICNGLSGLPCLTVTVDNGKEFAEHELVTDTLKAQVYFAHPHSPWERPTNENTNGLLRQFFSKDTNFKEVKFEQVILAVDLLNHRPRKCLGWKSPFMAFQEELLHLA